MNPTILNAHMKAYETKRKIMDEQMWVMGHYIMSALDATVCNNSLWRGKHGKPHEYIKKPLMQSASGKMSEDDIQKQRELFVAQLKAMKMNFDVANNSKKKEVTNEI